MKTKPLNLYIVTIAVLLLSFVPAYIVNETFGFQLAILVMLSVSLTIMVYTLVRLQNIMLEGSESYMCTDEHCNESHCEDDKCESGVCEVRDDINQSALPLNGDKIA